MRVDPVPAAIMCNLQEDMKEFVNKDGSIVVKLDKALYGCIESAALWHAHLKSTIISLGYSQSKIDPCIFFKNCGKDSAIIGVHVDDLKIVSTSDKLMGEFKDKLTEVYKTITVHEGKVHNYVGMAFNYEQEGAVSITMEGFINDMIAEFQVDKISTTPAGNNLFAIRPGAKKLDKQKKEEFHSATAKLLYLAKRIRPDILLAISFLTTR